MAFLQLFFITNILRNTTHFVLFSICHTDHLRNRNQPVMWQKLSVFSKSQSALKWGMNLMSLQRTATIIEKILWVALVKRKNASSKSALKFNWIIVYSSLIAFISANPFLFFPLTFQRILSCCWLPALRFHPASFTSWVDAPPQPATVHLPNTLWLPLKTCKLITHASRHPLTLRLAICHGITSFQPIKSIRRIWFLCCNRGIPALVAPHVRGSNALASSIRRKPTDTSITGSVYPYTHQSPVCWCSLIHLLFLPPCTPDAPIKPPPTLPPVGAGGRASPLISSWNKQPGKHHETFKGGCAASFPLICTGKSEGERKKQKKQTAADAHRCRGISWV